MKNIVNKTSIILPILIVSLVFFGHVFRANASAYLIYLYYSPQNNTLVFDKNKSANVVLDKSIQSDYLDFAQNTSSGTYLLKLYDIDDKEIINTEFNKTNGAFVLQIPYFSLANKLKIIEKSSEKDLLQADLSKYLTCNGNGVCELEKGETALNCMGDCANSKPNFSEQTSNELKNNNGVIKDSSSGEILLSDPALIPSASAPTTSSRGGFSIFILILGIFIFVGTIGFLVYKKFIKKD